MICSNCSVSNSEDARFCENCGHPLSPVCPNCQAENNPGANYCQNCGTRLSEIRTGQAENPPFIPLTVAPAGFEMPTQLSYTGVFGERRVLTVLFADVVNSTNLAESLDPEEWAGFMNQVFSLLTTPVYRYGGTVARLMGDAFLAFFGAPQAHEDDPLRAVYAGIDMVSEARAFSARQKGLSNIDFAIRVGIHTGNVVVGSVGSNRVSEYTAMGDAVNLASRLQAMAQPFDILVSNSVFRQVSGMVDTQDLGRVNVRGKSKPVHIYNILAMRNNAVGDNHAQPGRQTALVGRQDQVATLLGLSQSLTSGRGHFVTITGEPGIGKSRLVTQWRSELIQAKRKRTQPIPCWAEGHCLSYGQDMPYHLLVSLIYSLLNVQPGAEPQVISSALQTLCSEMSGADAEKPDSFDFLSHMLLLPQDPDRFSQIQRLDPHTLQGKYRASLVSIIRSLATRHPLHLVLDDLHWADPSSVEILVQLLPLAEENPLSFCFLSRPEQDTSGWKLIAAALELTGIQRVDMELTPLSGEDSILVAQNVLDVEHLPGSLAQAIISRSDGNPLFIEELIHMLVDQGVLVQNGQDWEVSLSLHQMDIPRQLQGLLRNRIDRLPEETRQVLRMAAIIGRQFSIPLIEKLYPNIILSAGPHEPGDLQRHIQLLESAGLIHPQQTQPELIYEFRHSLLQEAVTDSILRSERRLLHGIVAEVLEIQAEEQQVDLAPALASHYSQAGQDQKAYGYTIHSGDLAYNRYANQEAINYYSEAIQIFERIGEEPATAKHIFERLGRAYEMNSLYQEALDTYDRMIETAIRDQNPAMEAVAVIHKATLFAMPNILHNPDISESLCFKALEMVRPSNDRELEARIYWTLQLVYSRTNRLDKAREYGEKSLALCNELNLVEQKAYNLNDLSEIYFSLGEYTAAKQAKDEVDVLWRELGNLHMLTDSLSSACLMYYLGGEFDEAEKASDEAFQISHEIGNLWGLAYSRMYMGYIQFDRGNVAGAIQTLEQCIETAQKAKFIAPLVITRSDLAHYYAYIGCFEKALELAEETLRTVEVVFSFWRPWVIGTLARIHILNGDLVTAHRYIEESHSALEGFQYGSLVVSPLYFAMVEYLVAVQDYDELVNTTRRIEAYFDQGIQIFQPMMYYSLGKCLMGKNQDRQAEDNFLQAQIWAEDIGVVRLKWMIEAELTQIKARSGDLKQARIYAKRTWKSLNEIAQKTKPGDDQRDFKEIPWVKKIIQPVKNLLPGDNLR